MPDELSQRLYPALYPNFDRQFDREAKAEARPPAVDLDEDDRPLWRRVAAGIGVDDEIDAAAGAWRGASDWLRHKAGLDTPEADAAAAALERRMTGPATPGPSLLGRLVDSGPVQAVVDSYRPLWTPTPEARFMADMARRGLDERAAERAPALGALPGPVRAAFTVQDDLLPRFLVDTAESSSHPIGALSNLDLPVGALGKGAVAMAHGLPPELLAAVRQLFPKYDKYSKPAGFLTRASILKRAEEAADLAPEAKAELLRLADVIGERRVAPAELHALAAGETYTPDRVLRKVKAPVEGVKDRLGAPLGITNARQERAARERYLQLMDEGMLGRDWYHDTGDAIRFYANDDPVRAMQLAEDIAATSSATSVAANTGFGVKGYNQATAGVPIITGRFPSNMGARIAEIHDPEIGGLTSGLKHTAFADNIARGGGFLRKDAPPRAVHDIWEGESYGYVNPDGSPLRRGFTPPEHRWMDRQSDKIVGTANERALGGYTDWDHLRSQAASWTGAKVRAGKGKMTPEVAAADPSRFFEDLVAQGSRETMPGETTNHLPELFDPANEEFRQRLHQLMTDPSTGIYDPQGRDQIAAGYGGLVGRGFEGPGVFEGNVSPGWQTKVLTGSMDAPEGGRVLDEGSRRILDASEATHGLLMGQDASAYSRILPAATAAGRNGWDVALPGGTITPTQMRTVLAQLGPLANQVALVPTPDGIRLGFMDEATMQGIVATLGGRVKTPGTLQGGYIANNWKDLPVGQGYFDAIRKMGTEKFDRFAPAMAEKIRQADALFARETGGRFTLSPMLDEVRAAIAGEGFAGLERLAKKYGLPVALLAAGLSALGSETSADAPPPAPL